MKLRDQEPVAQAGVVNAQAKASKEINALQGHAVSGATGFDPYINRLTHLALKAHELQLDIQELLLLYEADEIASEALATSKVNRAAGH